MKALGLLPLIALAGCSAVGQGPTTLSGSWGGPGIALTLEGGLGTVEYNCASGTIDQPIPMAEVPFSVTGMHREGATGPVRVGQIFRSQRATYTGLAVKQDLTLNVKLEDGTELGPFKLVQGTPPQISRCET